MYAHRYKPYNSDSDSESDSDETNSSTRSETDESVVEGFQATTDDAPIATADFKALADALMKPISAEQDASGEFLNKIINPGGGYEITPTGLIKPPAPPAATNDKPPETTSQTITNVIMIDSKDRDTAAYPQPTNLTLRLPRTYKNVTGFTIIQMKLLSAFYYFSASKQNTNVSILEIGRTTADASDNIISNNIREGTYDINSLITELTTQLNRTPIFYDFVNGFQDFAQKFATTGDFSMNFNFPGDTYFDSLLNQFIPNPTMTLIVSKYFVSQYASLSSYSTDQIKIAYYYPVLKEAVLDPDFINVVDYKIVTSVQYLLDTETPYSRIVYTFQGIMDPVILELINLNIDLLTKYRLEHTFRYTLINKYVINYQQQSNQIVISSPSLNTSLVNLLTYKRSQYFAEQLSYYGLTIETYNSLSSQNTILLAILNDMVNFYQIYLATYFGINYNTYSLSYLLTPSFPIAIRDGLNAIGINTNFNALVTQAPISSNIAGLYKVDAPTYWNRMKRLQTSTLAYMNPSIPDDPFIPSQTPFNYDTWNNEVDMQDSSHPFVLSNVFDSNNTNTTTVGNLYINRRTQFSDVMIPTKSSQYTVFRFKSPVRQTLRIETLPRPTKYRYPNYNAVAYDLSHQRLFDLSYAYVAPLPAVDVSSNSFNVSKILYVPGFSTSASVAPFGVNYSTSTAYWGANYITLSVIDTRSFNTFYTPYPTSYTSNPAPAYNYPLRLTFAHPIEGQGFTTPVNCFIYQDRSAFMADISGNGHENPMHYSYYVSTSAGLSTVSLDITAYANRQYYVLLRPFNASFPTETLRIIPWFPSSTYYTALTSTLVGFNPLADPTSNLTNYNYASLADPAFLQLPTASTLYAPPLLDVTYSPLTFSTGIMGYDVNGVSTDLTNYIGFLSNVIGSNSVPTASIRTDPTNGYIFQYKTPYNTSTSQYIFSGTSNSILYPAGAQVYQPSTISYRQKSIVNWYGNVFIPPSKNQLEINPSSIASFRPYSYSYPVGQGVNGYNYYTRYDVSGNLYLGTSNLVNLGDGVMGIGFLPEQGVWDIDQFMFKSVYTDSNDPNLAIQYLGIYPAVVTSNQEIQSLPLKNACAVLSFTSSITYNAGSQNFGFDVGGGTYYEFKRNTGFLTGSNSYLYGYSQSSYEYNFDVNMYYVAVPFDAYSNVIYYHGLVGSAVPYPLYTPVAAVDSVPSPEGPISPPNGAQFVVPNGTFLGANPIYGPPAGYTTSESKYEQSMTSVTNLILYANAYPINAVSNVFKPATEPFSYEPIQIIADCSGFIMTYDSIFKVYSYPTNISTLTLHEVHEFTLDQIYPVGSNIQYLGVAANESNYAFFGLSNTSLYIRTFDPILGTVGDAYSEPCPLAFQSSVQLFRATYNNLGGYTLSAQAYDAGTDTSYLEVVSKAYAGVSTFTKVTYTTLQSTITNFIVQQSPKEIYGRFWVFPDRASGITDFFSVNPNQVSTSTSSADYTAIVYGGSAPSYANVTRYDISGQQASNYYSPVVTRDVELDRIFFLSMSGPTNFFEAPTTSTTPTLITGEYVFPSSPSKLVGGATGSIWGNIYNTIYGNRHSASDAPKKSSQAWQIFNPVQRIVFHQISKNFSFLLDLSGRKFPEYPHTAVAVYDSSGGFMNDTVGKWGLESASNFVTADFNTSGYYFNAYDYVVPLQDNRSSDDYYYMSIRNYFPTEEAQVNLRISAPNKYTFGYVTPTDLSGEISTAINLAVTPDRLYSRYWDRQYINSITAFNSNFIIGPDGKTFGGGVIAGFPGSNISSVNGFGDFYSRILSVYSTYSTLSILASTINTNINTSVNNFILSEMKYIIPPSAQNRQRSTDPLRFSIKWKSALTPNYLALEDSWGLGWNLGYTKADTPFATVQIAQSFFKLIDDFIRLRLNPEFDMNRMDTSAKENLAVSLESTGQTKTYYGKLLLANFGSYAQTMISNPIAFLNPLGKLDKLTFQWLDATNTVLNNNDCEWNAVVQITEKLDMTPVKKEPPFNQTLYS
jgi:hypothetical protein